MHRRPLIALAVIVAAAPARVLGAQGPADTTAVLRLSRADAVSLALAHNPALRAAREVVAETRAQGVQLAGLPEPSLAAEYAGESGVFRPSTAGTKSFGLGLTIPFPDKVRLNHDVAHANTSAADFDFIQLRQQTASQAAQAYDALLVAQRHHADLIESRQLAEDFLKKTQARFEAGTAAKIDVIKAQVDVAQAQNDLIASDRDIANARAALNRLMGRVLGAGVEPSDSLGVPAEPPELAQLEQIALQRRPELQGMESQRAGARAAATLAKEYWLPDLDVAVTRDFSPGAPTSFTTDVGFGLPLFFWQHQRGEVAEASHRQRELDATFRDLRAQVEQDVQTTYAGATTALRQAIWLRDQLLPQAREAYRITSVSYGLGGSSALDVLDARRTLLDAESQYAEALGAVNDAMAELQRAIGAPLDTVPGNSTGGQHHD